MFKSRYTLNQSPVYVSDHMSGKLEGIPAISTSVLLNPICQARAKDPDSVCAKCFAMNTVNRYKDLRHHLEENTEALTKPLALNDLPRFALNVGFVREEAFGDTQNVTQAINYINIAMVNPSTRVTVWTKNPKHYMFALEEVEKPENLTIIYSSPHLNKEDAYILERYPFIDKVFTVYTDDYIKEHGIEINCGGRKCVACGRCYLKNDERFIRERLK